MLQKQEKYLLFVMKIFPFLRGGGTLVTLQGRADDPKTYNFYHKTMRNEDLLFDPEQIVTFYVGRGKVSK